jgi:hypothetical protein
VLRGVGDREPGESQVAGDAERLIDCLAPGDARGDHRLGGDWLALSRVVGEERVTVEVWEGEHPPIRADVGRHLEDFDGVLPRERRLHRPTRVDEQREIGCQTAASDGM